MQNQKEILDLFVGHEPLRPILHKPFRQGGYIFASNGKVIIRVDQKIVDRPEQFEATDKVNALTLFHHGDNCDVTITADKLTEVLGRVPQGVSCQDCSGTGHVDFSFRSRRGNKYYIESECPVCDGTGIIDPYFKYVTKLGKGYYVMNHLSVLLQTAKLMGLDTITKVHDSDSLMNIFRFTPEVTVGIVTSIVNEREILRRNGWSDKMFSMYTSPVSVWEALLSDPAVEALAKTGQYDVMDYWFKHGGPRRDKSQWLPLVKICNRKKYIIKDASMWFDYIDLLEYFHRDTHSPHYICPENLKHEHDRLMDKKTRIEKALELKRQIAQAEKYEEQYRENYGMFFGICFGDENIVITVIGSVKEMAEEGTMMHHCVYSNGYYDFKRHPYSLILSARNRDGHRLETVEINTKTWCVVQSRGLQNGNTPFHSQIVKLVEQNIGLFKKAL